MKADTICCYSIHKRTQKKHCRITSCMRVYIYSARLTMCEVQGGRVFVRIMTTLENTPILCFEEPLKFIANGCISGDYSITS